MPLYVGTSGWAYPSWKPAFYPEKLAQKKFLNFYATKLNTVEGNFTFRQLVKETTIQNWLADHGLRVPANGRVRWYPALIAPFLPVTILQSLVSRTATMAFVARRPEG